jgi:hypothetical protein
MISAHLHNSIPGLFIWGFEYYNITIWSDQFEVKLTGAKLGCHQQQKANGNRDKWENPKFTRTREEICHLNGSYEWSQNQDNFFKDKGGRFVGR